MNEQQTDIEGTIRAIRPDSGEVKIDSKWYDCAPGLLHQIVVYFPVGTHVKAGIVGQYTIKSLVKQDPELIG